jgi:hypothetical protein
MIERIRELSDSQIDSLKKLGQDALTAISPPVAYLVYGNGPDQLTALQRMGPDELGAISPQLADELYGNAGNQDQGLGQYAGNTDQGVGQPIGKFEKGLGRYPEQPPIILPPFPQPPRPPDDGGDDGPFPPYPDDEIPPDDIDDEDKYKPEPGEYVSWNVDPGLNNCEVCLGNADDDPRPYGTEFSSGDTEPPAHAHCGCFLTSSLRGCCPTHGSGRRIFELSHRY